MLLMKDRGFLYELRAYHIYVKVGERSFLYELRAYLIYVKVGEIPILFQHFEERFKYEITRKSLELMHLLFPWNKYGYFGIF